jgi:hypothetical protein
LLYNRIVGEKLVNLNKVIIEPSIKKQLHHALKRLWPFVTTPTNPIIRTPGISESPPIPRKFNPVVIDLGSLNNSLTFVDIIEPLLTGGKTQIHLENGRCNIKSYLIGFWNS